MDSSFYIVAVIAVLLVGFGKGGLGDALGLMGVPILSFVMPTVQAAAILLPILIVMDVVALWTWRSHWNRQTFFVLLPGALIGILIGWLTFAHVPDYVMRLLIGAVALSFTATWPAMSAIRRGTTSRCALPSGARFQAMAASSRMQGARPSRFMRYRSSSRRRTTRVRRCASSPSSMR